MKSFQKFFKLICLALLSMSFSQCACKMKLQNEAPTTFGETYYQSWVAGVKGGGSGTNVFIEVKDENITLDSIYFRGKVSKFETKPSSPSLYIGRFKGNSNTEEKTVISSNDNKVEAEDFPFKLKENECVVSYTENEKVKYYKISNLKKKPLEALPMSAPPNKN